MAHVSLDQWHVSSVPEVSTRLFPWHLKLSNPYTMKIKTGDMVRIMVGKDKGKEGKVMQTFPDMGLVVVEGIRASTRHLKPRGQTTKTGEKAAGQRVSYNAPIRVDNVALVQDKVAGRVGYKVDADGKKERVLKTKKGAVTIG